MNSKSIVKRTLPLIIALVVIIAVALIFTLFSGAKPNPNISNPDGVFMKSGEVEINNEQMYKELKQAYGYNTLLEMMDKYLLGKAKDKNGKPYYASIDQLSEAALDEIDERIEKAIFPNGRTGVEADDEKTIKTWEDNMFMSLGLKNRDQIREYYNLIIARENYVRDTYRKKYEDSLADDEIDDLITESDIKTYYESNYQNKHWVIVIPYNTSQEAKDALGQIGIEIKQIKDENDRNITAWVRGGTEDQLGEEEIKLAFITLFNNANAYKAVGYPNNANPSLNIVVREGVHYTVEGGNIVFNTTFDEDLEAENIQEDANLFYHTMAELTAMNANLGSYINRELRSITNESASLLQTYSVNPKTFSGANKYYFVLKIAQEEAVAQSEVEDEIITKIIDSRVASQQATILKELRASYRDNGGFIIYDTLLESKYISQDKDHPLTKKKSETTVLQIGDYEVTADQLFAELSKRYGEIESIRFFGTEYLLYSEYNKIYEYKGRDQEGTVLDQSAWNDILDLIDLEKTKLGSGQYEEQGFPSTYGWKKFLNEYFGVENEDELKITFLYNEVQKEFAKAMAETTQETWDEIYLPQMNKIYNTFINARGMHILIHRQDETGKIIDPEDWNEYEIELAEELHSLIIDRLEKATPAQLETLMRSTIGSEYTNAPKFLAGLTQVIENQPVQTPDNEWLKLTLDSYKYSKYKSAGFLIKFEELTITAGQMVKPFEDAVREIWDEAIANNVSGDHFELYKDFIVTEFGYHVYYNTYVSGRTKGTKAGVETEVEIPTRETVLKYEEDTNHGDLDAYTKLGITTYYTPIRNELRGQYYPQLQLNIKLLADLDNTEFVRFSFNDTDYLERAIKLYNDAYYRQLRYVDNPDEAE